MKSVAFSNGKPLNIRMGRSVKLREAANTNTRDELLIWLTKYACTTEQMAYELTATEKMLRDGDLTLEQFLSIVGNYAYLYREVSKIYRENMKQRIYQSDEIGMSFWLKPDEPA